MCEFNMLDLCLSGEAKEQRLHSRILDRLLKESKRMEKHEIKLLLLGTGESGKSTFIRQMRIIYDNGYPVKERLEYVKPIIQNIATSVQAMIKAMEELNIKYEHEESQRHAELFMKLNCNDLTRLPDIFLGAINSLWQDAGIQECYRRRNEYQLTDSIKYYLTHINRIGGHEYLPTEDDILHVRVPTTGLVEYPFKIQNITFRMIDVGGQRSQRRKWMHCFDNAKVIIFLVAISEYDQVLRELEQTNRLIEARNVFQSIANYEWFKDDTSIVMFFNKTDLLEEKLRYSDLAAYFPDYTGPKNDYLAARDFIRAMFLSVTDRTNIYKHFTCATDTKNIEVVFAVVRDTILEHHLKGALV
ncbi:guanine nucleotide-binding protein subunit alpha-11 [Stomoxys calcitrans]|uniref:Guanine nucleotide-binding protein subunit alpha n=1 Tax=Stomoxys calcitrans TaxID=35570 RepID=A0A1I8PHS5_STOCA|nr:guanine nucleotide-binding protein subunit alpha-11 [Stomoxys calcitrans]